MPPKSKLKGLNPFMDDKGILKVGGRQSNANLNYYKKHPAILPQNNKILADKWSVSVSKGSSPMHPLL